MIFGDSTQAEVADQLTQSGLSTDQTKVSAWLRGRVPNLEQMNSIEDCYQLPHGTILMLSGFIDVTSLAHARLSPEPGGIRVITDEEAHRRGPQYHGGPRLVEMVLAAGGAIGSQFAVAAEGSPERPPQQVGRRVNRPQPPADRTPRAHGMLHLATTAPSPPNGESTQHREWSTLHQYRTNVRLLQVHLGFAVGYPVKGWHQDGRFLGRRFERRTADAAWLSTTAASATAAARRSRATPERTRQSNRRCLDSSSGRWRYRCRHHAEQEVRR